VLSITTETLDGHEVVIGVDETGRGSIAGPVAVGATLLKMDQVGVSVPQINDSKELTLTERQHAAQWIADKLPYSVEMVDASYIDKEGINPAISKAAERCLRQLFSLSPLGNQTLVVFDGNRPLCDAPVDKCVIKGDSSEFAVACASIMAKTARDSFMDALHTCHPVYGWDVNHGYYDSSHVEALRLYGMTEYHRRSFIHFDVGVGDSFSEEDQEGW